MSSCRAANAKKRMLVTNSQGGYADLTFADGIVREFARWAFQKGDTVTVTHFDGVATRVSAVVSP